MDGINVGAGDVGLSVGDGVLVNGCAAVDVGVGGTGVGCGAQAVKGRIIPSVTSKNHSLFLLICKILAQNLSVPRCTPTVSTDVSVSVRALCF